MSSKILILGRGFIGDRLQKAFNCNISDKRIYSFNDAQEEVKRSKPKIIINCIGHIGRNVDDCELNKDKTLKANVFIPIMLAEIALRNRIGLIHISSGCIYHFNHFRDKPIGEKKMPDYFDLFYSRMKIYSEQVLNILSSKFPVLIARIRIPLDNRPHPRNILTKLINYKDSVVDIPNSLTYVPDFIKALKYLIRINARGIYNIVNKGALRYPQLLNVYKKYVPDFDYRIISYKKFRLIRTNLILSTKKLEQSGFKVRNINEVIEECVRDYLKYS
jgi:dTDP-4-dehydrorhamnose reductase